MSKVLGWTLFETDMGLCALAWTDIGICASHLLAQGLAAMARRYPGVPGDAPLPVGVQAARAGIQALLAGRSRDTLEQVALDESALPAFYRRVYAATRQVPVGQTCGYGELAARVGQPEAARAVGVALGRNPFAPLVPCHRVIGSQGHLVGFSAPGGLRTKQLLLALEARAAGQWVGEQGALF